MLTFRSGAIGDTLVTFPIIKALRGAYQPTHLALICHPGLMELAKTWRIADEVHDLSQFPVNELYDEEGISSQNWLRLLQQSDLAVSLLRNGADPLKQNLLTAGAKEALVAHEYQDPVPKKHVVEYLAESIGLQGIHADDISPITPPEKVLCLYKPPVAIHPGSSEEARRWPASSFAAIINQLMQLQQPVLLLAGPLDAEQLREVRRHLLPPPAPGMLTILRNAPLLEVARRIRQCKCYLGNDSGITHLASLLGVPTVVLVRPHFVLHMHALGPSVDLVQEDRLARLPVERVFEKVKKYL